MAETSDTVSQEELQELKNDVNKLTPWRGMEHLKRIIDSYELGMIKKYEGEEHE